ncbi:MAG: type I glyceraldehyde-3-phosphate dehydrogenase [Phycisphaerales bacterium]
MPNSPIRIGINGFGRIGRLVYRIAKADPSLQVVAVNDLVPADNLAYLLKYDTMHGTFGTKVATTDDSFSLDGELTHTYAIKNPAEIPWNNHAVDYVLESTGLFTTKDDAGKHLAGGIKRVIISAPTKSPDSVPTFVYKVNEDKFDPKSHTVISNASCTTNCLAPVAKVVNDNFGIEEGLMTTIHAVTATQPTQDGPSRKDWRGGRNAYMNIIPASTGAAKAVALCLPELKGKLTGMSFRVPTADVSCVDLTIRTTKSTSLDQIHAAMKQASENQMAGVLGYTEDQVVSSDFVGDHRSSIYDAGACIQLSDRFFKLVSWYDNEAGYAARCVDMLRLMARHDGLLK